MIVVTKVSCLYRFFPSLTRGLFCIQTCLKIRQSCLKYSYGLLVAQLQGLQLKETGPITIICRFNILHECLNWFGFEMKIFVSKSSFVVL